MTMCELLTGDPPYLARRDGGASASRLEPSPLELLMAIVYGPAPQLDAARFAPAMVDFVCGCCAKEPEQRPTPAQLQVRSGCCGCCDGAVAGAGGPLTRPWWCGAAPHALP